MEIKFTKKALEDFEFWKKSGNKIIQKKIENLLSSIRKDPFSGVGKPEKLKHQLSGSLSRRINGQHRLVYLLEREKNLIIILTMRFHY